MNKIVDGVKEFIDFFNISAKKPSIDLLTEILNFFSQIPYENFTKIISFYSKNDQERLRFPKEVMDGYINYKTGGTCFSLSYFLKSILDLLGFESYLVSADRTYGNDTHCGVIVKVNDDKFFLDRGFLKSEPIPINCAIKNHVKSEINDMIIEPISDNLYKFYTLGHNGLKYRYTLKDIPCDNEYFIKLWKASFSFTMMNSLIYTRMEKDKQLYVRNNNLLYISRDGKEKKKLERIDVSLKNLVGIDEEIVREAIDFLHRAK